jgi:DNA polymerase-3 subunit alpha
MTGQSRIFDLLGEKQSGPVDLADVPEWPERQLLAFEKETLGFYITGHPLAQFETLLKQYANFDTASLAEAKDKQEVRIGGVAAKLREITTKRGDRMGFVTLEDLKGSSEIVVFSDVYAQSHLLVKSERPFFVLGQADTDGETVKIIARQILPIEEIPEHLTKSIHFILHAPEVSARHIQQLKSVLARFPGKCPGFVHLVSPNRTETVLALPDDLKLVPTTQLVVSVEKLFGHNVTRFVS